MAAMADLGVTGLLELPPAGTLTGIAKRNLKGVELFALNTPDQTERGARVHPRGTAASRDRRPRSARQPDLAPGGLAGQGPVQPDRGHRGRHAAAASTARSAWFATAATRSPVSAPYGGIVVEWLVEDGDPVSPGQPLLRLHPTVESRRRDRGDPMTAPRADLTHVSVAGARALPDPRHRRLPAAPGRRQRGDLHLHRLLRRVDPDAVRASRSAAGPREDETIQMMSIAAARKAIERAGIEPGQVDTVIVSTVTHLHQTPAIATTIASELGAKGAAAFDISAACAGFCYMIAMADSLIRTGVVEVRADHRRRAAQRHDRHATTARPRSSSPTAPGRPWSDRATPRRSARSSGAPTATRPT